MLIEGREVDRYVVEGVIGRGGMAEVYRVRHTRLNSVHALKVLTLSSKGLRQRLLQEGQAQASLRHPNVVAVTDVLDIDGQPGLVMEYIDGPSLDEWLATNRPDVDRALQLFRGIVSAVQAAHAAGLVHRDLKPANVLLASYSSGLVPKVMDFGLAKALAEEHVGHGATRSGIAMGTPRYMAPEQIRDAKSVDERADLFSLGCLLYELLTGQPPFDGPDVLSVFNRVSAGAYPSPESLVPGLPSEIDTAIRGCIVVDADRRVPDCATLLGILDGAAFTPPPIPSGPSIPRGLDSSETWAGGEVGPIGPSEPTLDLGRGLLDGSAPERTAPPTSGDTLVPGGASVDRSATSSPAVETTGRRLGWLAIGGIVAAVAVVLVLGGLAVLGVGGWFTLQAAHASGIRAALAGSTSGEAAVDRVQLQLGGLVLHGLHVDGPDGVPVVRAQRVRLTGPGVFWSGAQAAERVEVEGLDVELRRGQAGWVVPEHTIALLQGARPSVRQPARQVHIGPARLVAQGSTGTLIARWAGADIAGLARGADGWTAESWRIMEPTVADHMPILEARSIRAEGSTARVDGLMVWLSTRDEGWLALPPMIADAVPSHFGGTAGGESWIGGLVDASPVPIEAVQIDAGVLHLVDTANGEHEVEWAALLDQARMTRTETGWRATALGELDRGRLSVDLGPGPEGELRGRVEIRELPLVALAPYLGGPLSERGVAIDDGMINGVVDLEEQDRAMAFMAALDIAKPVLVPLSGDGSSLSRRDRRLLAERSAATVSLSGIGMLTDMSYRPVQDLLRATADELLSPAGRSATRLQPRKSPAAVPPPREVPDGATTNPNPDAPVEAEPPPPDKVPRTLEERWERRRKEGQRALEDWLEKQTRR